MISAGRVVRSGPPTPDEKRAAFPEYLADALGGALPPSDTGLHNDTIAALENLAVAAAVGQPTDVLVAVARAAFDVEMDDRRVRLVDYARHRRTRR